VLGNPEILAPFLVGMWNAEKCQDGEDEGSGKGMTEKSSQEIVHVSQGPCILPGCLYTFVPKRKGQKAQKFCSPKSRAKYLSLARTIGR